jgi:sterol desaturase/sphingolipid hydroxylase (fatty acid hydroxylase superfamily)
MHALIAFFSVKLASLALFFGVGLGGLTALEFLLPRDPGHRSSRRHAAVFWLIWLPATALTFTAFTLFWQTWGWRPAFTVPLAGALARLGPARLLVAPALGALVGDFFFYWFHRGQHAFFWPFHAVHHSIEDLNAANSYHHVTEELMRSLLLSLPMSWFTIDYGAALPLAVFLFAIQPIYIHSPTRVNFGRWRVVLADNHFHRIHHSLEPKHFDRNFGATTTLWDRLFGTAYFPGPDEWPVTGVAGVAQPTSVRAWLTLPFAVMQGTRAVGRSGLAEG